MFRQRLAQIPYAEFAQKQRQRPDVIKQRPEPEQPEQHEIRQQRHRNEQPHLPDRRFGAFDMAFRVLLRTARDPGVQSRQDLVTNDEARLRGRLESETRTIREMRVLASSFSK